MKKNKSLEYYLDQPYKIELHYEPGDNTWVATHPELGRGSCYAIGESKDEALKRLEEERKFILQYALDEGHSIPEPKFEEEELPSGQFVVRLPRSLHKKLKDKAKEEDVSLNQYVVSIISEYIGANQIKKVYQRRTPPVQAVREKSRKYSSPKKHGQK
jgi:predicted HicB family RNase H-like nuclease